MRTWRRARIDAKGLQGEDIMLEAKYYRDYGHNYLILQCVRQEATESYPYKILTSGRIREILPCSVRHINGSAYCYYDISSRVSLDSLYHGKKMSCGQVKDVLRQICGICEKLAGCFMDESGLVLMPEHIYYDITSQKYIGLYDPDHRSEVSGGSRDLADFLLEHIDTEDRGLTEKMYRICEIAESDCFFAKAALRILEEGETPAPELPPETVFQESGPGYDIEPEQYDVPVRASEPDGRERTASKRNLFYPVFAVLSALGIAGAVAVYSVYELTQREEFILYGVMAAMGVCLLLCAAGICAERKKRYASDRNAEREAAEKETPDHAVDTEVYSLAGVLDRDMDLEMAACGAARTRHMQENGGPFWDAADGRGQGSGDYGDTVFYDERAAAEHKLYALDKKNKNHIELKRFPYTIGKMAGCVDHVISDDSVSRIHARFDMQDDKVLVTDMNSTNGTYKNGLRMQPRETVEIEPGDELRFGSLNYCYR